MTHGDKPAPLRELASRLAQAENLQAVVGAAVCTLGALLPACTSAAAVCEAGSGRWHVAVGGAPATGVSEVHLTEALRGAPGAATLTLLGVPANLVTEVTIELSSCCRGVLGVVRGTPAPRPGSTARLLDAVAAQTHVALASVLRLQERRQLERRRREHNEFLSIISHDLRTPLTAIRGYAQLLHRRTRSEALAELRTELGVIIQQADRLAADTEVLLDVARIETARVALQRGVVDLASVARSVAADPDPRGAAAPEVHVGAIGPLVEADSRRTTQMVRAMIRFAMQRAAGGAPVQIRILEEDGHGRITVEDGGSALDPVTREGLLERLVWLGEDGTPRGLAEVGLVIARGLAEAHGGRMAVESPIAEQAQGVRLSLWLPLHRGA